jgi:predicted transcriptional regulator
MYNNIKAKDIMTRKLIVLKTDDNIYQGLHALLSNQISGAPVVNEQGVFVGVFNEKSCMNVVVDDQYHGVSNTHVSDYMFQNVKTITPETSLIEIAMTFRNEPLRRLPVLVDDRLVGLVSRRDVLRAVESTLSETGIRRKGKSVAPMPYYSALIDPFDNSSNQA